MTIKKLFSLLLFLSFSLFSQTNTVDKNEVAELVELIKAVQTDLYESSEELKLYPNEPLVSAILPMVVGSMVQNDGKLIPTTELTVASVGRMQQITFTNGQRRKREKKVKVLFSVMFYYNSLMSRPSSLIFLKQVEYIEPFNKVHKVVTNDNFSNGFVRLNGKYINQFNFGNYNQLIPIYNNMLPLEDCIGNFLSKYANASLKFLNSYETRLFNLVLTQIEISLKGSLHTYKQQQNK